MPRKRHSPEEIVAKRRQVDVALAQDQSIAEAIKAIRMTENWIGGGQCTSIDGWRRRTEVANLGRQCRQ